MGVIRLKASTPRTGDCCGELEPVATVGLGTGVATGVAVDVAVGDAVGTEVRTFVGVGPAGAAA